MEQFWTIFWGLVGTVVTGLATWLTSYLISLITRKIKDQDLKNFLTKLTEIIMTSVNAINQTVVEEMKKAGTFNKEAAESVKIKCIDLIKSQLAPDMIQFIENNFGNLEDYLSTQIESFIFQSKIK